MKCDCVGVCRQLKNYCHRQCSCIYFFLSGYGNCNTVVEDIFCMNTYIHMPNLCDTCTCDQIDFKNHCPFVGGGGGGV